MISLFFRIFCLFDLHRWGYSNNVWFSSDVQAPRYCKDCGAVG